jgi:hypothetical protein
VRVAALEVIRPAFQILVVRDGLSALGKVRHGVDSPGDLCQQLAVAPDTDVLVLEWIASARDSLPFSTILVAEHGDHQRLEVLLGQLFLLAGKHIHILGHADQSVLPLHVLLLVLSNLDIAGLFRQETNRLNRGILISEAIQSLLRKFSQGDIDVGR